MAAAPVALLGVGGVGRALVEALVGARTHHKDVYGLRFDVKVCGFVRFLAGDLDDAQLRMPWRESRWKEVAGATKGDVAGYRVVGRGRPGRRRHRPAPQRLINQKGPEGREREQKPFSSDQAAYDDLLAICAP